MAEKGLLSKIVEVSHLVTDRYMSELKKSNAASPTSTKTPMMRHTWGQDLERINSEYGYRQKLTLLTDQHKLLMYLKDPIVSGIVQTLVTQACTFAVPQKDKYSPGFAWELKDPTKIPDESDMKNMHMLSEFILNTGIVDDEREKADELMSFETWMKVSIKDSLIYDTLSTEFVSTKGGRLHHFVPVSAASMRLAAKNLDAASLLDDKMFGGLDKPVDQEKLKTGQYKYVQVVNGQMRKIYTADEVLMEFRNPVNDLFTNGYPIGELDLLMNTVSAHLNADAFNRSIFTHGITSSGIINLKGEVDDEQLKAMRRSWYAQGIGVDSMLKTPIVNTPEGLEYIKLDQSHKDLEYSNYIQYLIKLICALYQIAPEELGFSTGGASEGDGNSQNYNNIERKLSYSKERCLRPLLRFIENIINEKILPKFSRELYKMYRFRFVGLDEEDRQTELERLEKEGKIYKTINEIRVEQGMDKLEGPEGDVVDNGTFAQVFMATNKDVMDAQQQAAQAAAPPGGGGAGAEGGDGQPGVQYVDEDGNPLDPSQIDPNTMEFEDETGASVDHMGNPREAAAAETDDSLPFDDALGGGDSGGDKSLPFEEGGKSHTGGDAKKLPWEM